MARGGGGMFRAVETTIVDFRTALGAGSWSTPRSLSTLGVAALAQLRAGEGAAAWTHRQA